MPDDKSNTPTASTTVDNSDKRDARITELESLLKEQTQKHDFQLKRADKAERALKSSETLVAKTKADLDDVLSASQETAADTTELTGDGVVLDGIHYEIVNTVRADNTFAEVKRGFVDEGACMVVINRPH